MSDYQSDLPPPPLCFEQVWCCYFESILAAERPRGRHRFVQTVSSPGKADKSAYISVRRLAAEGLEHHQAGNLPAAEAAYRAILARDPKHADALHLLGLIEGRRNPEAGVRLIEQAIARTWKVSAYHNNLGNLLLRVGNTSRAEASYRLALRLDARNGDAMLNLGKLLHLAGDLEGARRYISGAVCIAPGSVEAQLSLSRVEQASGAFALAAACCRRAIAVAPKDAPAYLLLAAAQVALGEQEAAEASLRRAIVLDRSFADAHFNLGNLLRAMNRRLEAAACYREAVELAPSTAADAWNNLAITLAELGQEEEALAASIQALALKPEDAGLSFNLGREAVKSGDLVLGRQLLEKALASDSLHGGVRLELGNLERREGRLAEAAEQYRRVIAQAPLLAAEACNNLGATLIDLHGPEALPDEAANGSLAEAEKVLRRAIELRPDYSDAWFNLGKLCNLQGRGDTAIELLSKALRLKADDAAAHQELGVAQERLGLLQAAVESYERSLALDPGSPAVRRNLAALQALMGEERGRVELAALVEEQPSSVEAHWARSMALLLHGQLREGWQEYEWRLQAEPFRACRRAFPMPRWRGEALEERAILVHAEQGLGDTLQFARYAPLVAKLGGRVILEVQPALQRLLASLPGITQCMAQGELIPTECALHVPLLSLPMALGEDAIPPPVRSSAWPEQGQRPSRAGEPQGRLEVGLAWAGAPGHRRDRLRSIPLHAFHALAAVEGVRFTSLQRGAAAEQAQQPANAAFAFSQECAGASDMLETAEVISGLDLVITVDTSVAHLAATLGVPTWILLDRTQDWRWGLRSRQTPWYPEAELFRQTGSGAPNWSPVLAEVAARLRTLAKGN